MRTPRAKKNGGSEVRKILMWHVIWLDLRCCGCACDRAPGQRNEQSVWMRPSAAVRERDEEKQYNQADTLSWYVKATKRYK